MGGMPKATEELQMIKDYLAAVLVKRFRGAQRTDQMQREFAREAGISEPHLSGILNHRKPFGESWAAIADALGFSMEKVLEDARKWRKENPPVKDDAVRELVKLAVDVVQRSGTSVSKGAAEATTSYLERLERDGIAMKLGDVVNLIAATSATMSKQSPEEARSRLQDGEDIEAATRRGGGRRSVTVRTKTK